MVVRSKRSTPNFSGIHNGLLCKCERRKSFGKVGGISPAITLELSRSITWGQIRVSSYAQPVENPRKGVIGILGQKKKGERSLTSEIQVRQPLWLFASGQFIFYG